MATYLDSLGENQFLVVRDINHPRQDLLISAPYKKYVAILTQSGTNPPTVDYVLENTFENPVIFYYDNVGFYRIGCVDFGEDTPTTTVWPMLGPSNQGSASKIADCYTTTAPISRGGTACEIAIETVLGSTPGDQLLFKTSIEIRVYK